MGEPEHFGELFKVAGAGGRIRDVYLWRRDGGQLGEPTDTEEVGRVAWVLKPASRSRRSGRDLLARRVGRHAVLPDVTCSGNAARRSRRLSRRRCRVGT